MLMDRVGFEELGGFMAEFGVYVYAACCSCTEGKCHALRRSGIGWGVVE